MGSPHHFPVLPHCFTMKVFSFTLCLTLLSLLTVQTHAQFDDSHGLRKLGGSNSNSCTERNDECDDDDECCGSESVCVPAVFSKTVSWAESRDMVCTMNGLASNMPFSCRHSVALGSSTVAILAMAMIRTMTAAICTRFARRAATMATRVSPTTSAVMTWNVSTRRRRR